MQPSEGEMACGEFGAGRLPEPEMVWLEIADMLGLDPGEAGPADIASFIEALEPEEEPPPPSDGARGGLAGLLSSIIPRSTARRIRDEEVGYSDEDFASIAPEDLPEPGPPLPDPIPAEGPVLARKGKARAAPPTDLQAIHHQVDPARPAPEPVAMPMAMEPEESLPPAFDPLAGQPDFDEAPEHRPLYGRHVLVTAGPTYEPIDPVRYIANRSSGKQGFAIAAAAAAAGARVTLISGPVALATPPGVDRIDVETAEEMVKAVKKALPADAGVMVAAVADWRTKDFAQEKIKKRGSAPPALLLAENPDILAMVAAGKHRPRLLIGFAAETEDVVANAQRKRKSKGVDWIVANDVTRGPDGESAMGGDENTVHLVREGKTENWEPMSKQAVARKLVERMAEALADA
jgi:phosphopantothenoylcysteine decarboxylase/phosphopantothenate--cysteine ligase